MVFNYSGPAGARNGIVGSGDAVEQVRAAVDAVYRADSRRVLATLIRLLGDFDLAEEAMHDAFTAAVEQWPRDGMPANPRAWLVSTGRFKSIDTHAQAGALRRVARRARRAARGRRARAGRPTTRTSVDDDRLRLIFTCCHPALTPDAQIALTLREVCGLTTEEIARAFFTSPSTVAQRIVRAKAKIRDARHPVSGAGARRSRRAPRQRAPRRLSRLQRGVLRFVRRVADAARSVRRGDPARASADRAAARAGGDRACSR